MVTTQRNSSAIQEPFDENIESTIITDKKRYEDNKYLFMNVLRTPNAIPNYTNKKYYIPTGQQNEIDYEKDVTEKINEFKFYEVNWDGYEGIAASSETVNDAIKFINKLPSNTTVPRPGLSGDGEISLFWEDNGVYIDIGFFGDGKYTLYAKDSQEIEYLRDDIDLSDPLPDALLNLIRKN